MTSGRAPANPDLPRLAAADRLGEALPRLHRLVRPEGVIAAWATVDLDRAEAELARAVPGLRRRTSRADEEAEVAGAAEAGRSEAPLDELLGARCRILDLEGGGTIVLLEPATEGLLAAALARHGEGPLAEYLVADPGAADRLRRAGYALTRPAAGPLGGQRRVRLGRRDGPFILLVAPG